MKKFLNHPWTIAIGTILLTPIASLIIDAIKGIKFLTTFKVIWKFLVHYIGLFLNFDIKVWWILVSLVILSLALYIVVKVANQRDNKNSEKVSFLSYTKDTLKGWKWEWTWEKNFEGKYEVKHLHPVCSACGTPLVPHNSFYGRMRCVRCSNEPPQRKPNENDILVLIYDNVKRKSSNGVNHE